ncbi:DUF429 domain-containing protein [Clostridium sp. PL3]|uniref:DUF429 domain-containing protein n=1 Tax=Clostridium thailandense TaxID=2794346 RepID=A0A949X3Q8_9CLOT|nr:DUF429 domain-containing protein [Clostridium thailandense]MBV7272763.1 DUF429 domain-containing protein [Clostridium thailandense]
MKSVGVDGCKSGWFAVSIYDNGKWELQIFKSARDLHKIYADSDIILIDIPIGLKDSGKEERLCDLKARKLLGHGRGSSVFPVPCRQAVYCKTYEEAHKTNKEILERGLSKQTWGIVSKIREVDEFVVNNEFVVGKLKESHPEVCFYALSGQPMKYSKKCKEGADERINVLRKLYRNTDEIIKYALNNYKRKEVALDDIIDALCLSISGLYGLENGFVVLPECREIDNKNIGMQILFAYSKE